MEETASLCREIRRLSGAETVLFTRREGPTDARLQVPIACEPILARDSEAFASMQQLASAVQLLPQAAILDGALQGPEVGAALQALGTSRAAGVPLRAGSVDIGTLLLLGLPPDQDLEPTAGLLRLLGPMLGLVFRNALLFGEQEQLIQARTAALRASEARFRGIVEHSPDVIFLARTDGIFSWVSPSAAQVLGHTAASLEGARLQSLAARGHLAGLAQGLAIVAEGRPVNWRRTRLRTAAGRELDADWTLVPLRGDDGERLALGILRDISATVAEEDDRRRLQQALQRGSTMEAIGRLSGGIAHDFNNLLTVITGNAALMKRDIQRRPALLTMVEEIEAAAGRAAALTAQLLAFGRKQTAAPRPADVNELLLDIRNMIARVIGEDVQVRLDLASTPCIAAVDAGLLERAILNLAANARDAMPDGGTLTVGTRLVRLTEAFCQRHPARPPGNYVQIAVEDTGCGMDLRTREHAFEPFFTTKRIGQGTGLGLATVHGIVHQHQGIIEVTSAPERGTRFDIYLPRTGLVAADDKRREELDEGLGGDETVLLVEDEDAVRSVARRILQQAGYDVIDAATGEQALESADALSGPIHLLVTDVVMPGMDGLQLASALMARRPGIAVLFMSGYAEDIISSKGIFRQARRLLPKPFTSRGLREAVRETLDGVAAR